MAVLDEKRFLILSGYGLKHGGIYKGMIELMSWFGYVSIQEVMYAYGLNLREGIDRLRYLERIDLIRRFPSLTVPDSFYCLTQNGRQAARNYEISDEVSGFMPSQYQWTYQQHHRSIIKVYLALRCILGTRFLGWASEHTLKAEEEARHKLAGGGAKRVLDGEFFLRIRKSQYLNVSGDWMEQTGQAVEETWRCGLEVELSLKSPGRYQKQFKELAGRVYDSFDNHQYYPMIIFVYNTPTLYDRLSKYLKSGRYNFGECVFYLAQMDEFLAQRGEARVEKFVGLESKVVRASEMNEIKVVSR